MGTQKLCDIKLSQAPYHSNIHFNEAGFRIVKKLAKTLALNELVL